MDESQELSGGSEVMEDFSIPAEEDDYWSDTSLDSYTTDEAPSCGPTWAAPNSVLYSMGGTKEEVSSPNDGQVHENLQFYKKSLVSDTAAGDHVGGPRFRLLQINPGEADQQISCNLILRPLFDAPAYTALSYSWGTSPQSSQIFIRNNASPFPVSAHLWKALWRLRDLHEVVTVWVDAICINQQDLLERADQVQIMAQIYNQASEVRVWLGDDDCRESINTPDAVLFLNLCQQQKPWWTRLWVVQECAYAQTCPIIMVSAQTMTLEDTVERWELAIRQYETRAAYGRQKLLAYHLALLRMPYDAWKMQAEKNKHRLPLWRRLQETANRQCTDPHDRVYAVLSLVDEKEALRIKPDYRKPHHLLLREVKELCMQSPDYNRKKDYLPSALDRITTAEDATLLESALFEIKTDALQALITNVPDNLEESCDTAFQAALVEGRTEIEKLQLVKGADIKINDYMKITRCPICHYRVRYNAALCATLQAALQKGYAETVDLLLRHVNFIAQGREYDSALCAASRQGHAETVKLLLEKGAEVNAKAQDYGNALYDASNEGYTEIVKILLKHGTDFIAQRGFYGRALYAASVRGHIETVKTLLEKGAEVIAKGDGSSCALYAASIGGQIETVKTVLEHGAGIIAPEGFNGSALYAASLHLGLVTWRP